jgi:hypothetical protein
MPPILRSDAGTNTIIRPLAYCQESEIAKYSEERQFPIIPCNLCGSQPNLKRARVKRLVSDLAAEIPSLRSSILTALTNVTGSHLLDTELYDFRNFEPIVKKIEFEGEDWLYFPAIKPDVAIIRATTADERGNLTYEHEGAYLGGLDQALAARNNGGNNRPFSPFKNKW